MSHWDGMEFVAHTMLSFGFEDGKHLALSVKRGCLKGGAGKCPWPTSNST
ncbi:MAG: hypothetical protein ACLRPT_04825 [Akkermansia muciniphila]